MTDKAGLSALNLLLHRVHPGVSVGCSELGQVQIGLTSQASGLGNSSKAEQHLPSGLKAQDPILSATDDSVSHELLGSSVFHNYIIISCKI